MQVSRATTNSSGAQQPRCCAVGAPAIQSLAQFNLRDLETSSQSEEYSKIVVLYGFSELNKEAQRWREKTVEVLADLEDKANTTLIECNSLGDIRELGYQDLSVLYLSNQDIACWDGAVSKIQTLLDGHLRQSASSQTSFHILVLLEGKRNSVIVQDVQQAVQQMVEAFGAQVHFFQSGESNTTDELVAQLKASMTALPPVSARKRRTLLGAPILDRFDPVSIEDAYSMDKARELVSSFIDIFDKNLARKSEAIGLNWNSTKDALRSVLRDSQQLHAQQYGDLFREIEGSKGIKAARSLAAVHVLSALTAIYDQLTGKFLTYLVNAFEKTAPKIPVSATIRKDLKKLSETALTKYTDILRMMQEDLNALLADNYGEGILQADLLSFSSSPLFSVHQMRSQLELVSKQVVEKLLAQGTINPFLRTSIFPPTHININFLISPQTSPVSKELYDEHLPGVSERRAYPMRFDGVAQYPFDFNEVPKSTEREESWLDMLKGFFGQD
eukprot:scaffold6634_cov229-Ochromonas_danica.AAC.7